MTGFGRATYCLQDSIIEVEVSSVNKRHLEIFVSAPKEWQRFEFVARAHMKPLFERGRIRISINVNQSIDIRNGELFNENYIQDDLNQLEGFLQKKGLSLEINASLILELANLRKNNISVPSLEKIQENLKKILSEACNNMCEMRKIEGSAIKEDFKKRINLVYEYLLNLERFSSRATSEYKNKLLDRLTKADLPIDLEDERILKEVTLFAEKTDTTEEITRIKSHLNQMNKTIETNGSIGRKIEFLLQEIARELNTYCSKTTVTDCTEIALNARTEVEKMREQSLNIE